jgi:hypothetical protein
MLERVLTLVAVAPVAVLAAASPVTSAPAAPCRSAVQTGVLPVWARSGFSDAQPRAPHVLGRAGDIVAILFAQPLRAPQPAGRTNKILWVSRLPFALDANLRISAQRMIGTRRAGSPVVRTIRGGPGPSIVDMPRPGCWRLTMRWSRHADSLDLEYLGRLRPLH